MTEPYTPTTTEVRNNMAFGVLIAREIPDVATDPAWPSRKVRDNAKEAFDRWLAEHDRQTAETAWGDGYGAGQDSLSGPTGEYVDDPRLKNPHRKEDA